ncbi:MAG: hypothetical protein WC455_24110 [Dehalococcoidia bacterium]|jgi:hypothetical protein
MEEITIIALAPFYALGVVATAYAAGFAFHQLKKLDASATETQMTETTSPASTQQK